jgi:polyisoprenoid-binding protein YceI
MITKWKIDPMHSEIHFKVKHLMITSITGSLTSYNVSVETVDEDFTKATKIDFVADVDAIDTGNEQRDAHLKSEDFFNGAEHKAITFKGNKLERSGNDYKLHGDLAIRGVTRPVTLKAEFGGIVVDQFKQTKAGFSVIGQISRKDYGITSNGLIETGGVAVSDEVWINCEVQLIKQ